MARFFYSKVIFHCVYTSFVIYSVDGDVGSFHILTFVNKVLMDIGVHVSFQNSIFVFLSCTPRSGVVGSYSSSIFHF